MAASTRRCGACYYDGRFSFPLRFLFLSVSMSSSDDDDDEGLDELELDEEDEEGGSPLLHHQPLRDLKYQQTFPLAVVFLMCLAPVLESH